MEDAEMKRNVKAGARLVQSLGRNKAASDMDGLMECLYCPRGVYGVHTHPYGHWVWLLRKGKWEPGLGIQEKYYVKEKLLTRV